MTVVGIQCHVVHHTRRWPTSNVDRATAQRHANVAKALRDTFGHANAGVFLRLAGSGSVTVADVVASAAEARLSAGLR